MQRPPRWCNDPALYRQSSFIQQVPRDQPECGSTKRGHPFPWQPSVPNSPFAQSVRGDRNLAVRGNVPGAIQYVFGHHCDCLNRGGPGISLDGFLQPLGPAGQIGILAFVPRRDHAVAILDCVVGIISLRGRGCDSGSGEESLRKKITRYGRELAIEDCGTTLAWQARQASRLLPEETSSVKC